MRKIARLALVGVTVAASLLLSGCVQPPTVVSAAPSPTATPLFESDAAALAAATKAYAAYLAMSDEIFMNGGSGSNRMRDVETGAQLKADQDAFATIAKNGEHSTGGTIFDQVELQQYDAGNAHGKEIVVVYLCEDITAVDVFNADGKSIVSAQRPNRVLYQVSFDQTPHSDNLRVSRKQPWGDKSC